MSRDQFLSLFSGAGGLDLGLEAAGFSCAGLVEIDENCIKTLQANRPDWKLLGRDVNSTAHSLKPSDLGLDRGELAILGGAPPCQPFSTAGQWTPKGRLGMSDGRTDTLESYMKLVDSFLPAAILFENVASFAHGSISANAYLQEKIAEINEKNNTSYELNFTTVDSADFGVAQHRRRAIGIAFRDGRAPSFKSTAGLDRITTSWDALFGVSDSDLPSASGKWAGLLPSIPEGANYQYLTSRGGGKEVFGYRTRFWSFLLKLAKDQPSWTLAASPGPSTGPFHWDNRPLSVRERARIQSFPDSWRFPRGRSGVSQTGNATPPLLAQFVGDYLADALEMTSMNSPAGRLMPYRAEIPPPPAETPAEVPSEYLVAIADKSDHPGPGLGPSPRSRRTREN